MDEHSEVLRGRVAVVTGGTRGIGADIVRRYAEEGATVVCAGRDERAAAEALDGLGDRAAFHPVDVGDQESVRALFAHVAARYGALDVLVANAGVSRPGPIATLDPAAFTETLSTNVTGVFLTIREAVPLLEKDGGGRVVVLSSVLGSRVVPGASAYCASKAAVEALTKVAALELAGAGITVNALSPGFIDSGMGKQLAANEQVWSKFKAKLAAGRMGTAAEVAAAAVFLASGASSYVSGQVLGVDGALFW
ncbi:SDR family NAD(P)-dependent oxidoreductase [Actinokineospora sp. G85]|uniref:SDR family NAD(P)-dependent oxidoreductase n=1 Tax=Actinokineospora sp. G85 TaxID=3406626 RepID=UPI003C7200BA